MGDPTHAAAAPRTAEALELARWRGARAVMAGLCVACFVLWLLVMFTRMLGPLTRDVVTTLLTSVVLAWVVVDVVVKTMSRRAGARS